MKEWLDNEQCRSIPVAITTAVFLVYLFRVDLKLPLDELPCFNLGQTKRLESKFNFVFYEFQIPETKKEIGGMYAISILNKIM